MKTTKEKHLGILILCPVICGLLLFAQQGLAAVEVFVSVPPQKWLSDTIGGELVVTRVLVDKGQDPHTFEPTPKQVAALTKARLYFAIGLEFEEQIINKIRQSSANVQIVDTSLGLEKFAMVEHHHKSAAAEGHHDEPKDAPDHKGMDPHVWLSPLNLKIMAAEMARALITEDPENREVYVRNLDHLAQDLEQMDKKIAHQLQPFAGSTFFVFHPSFGYFAKRYNLKQEAVELEGKSPTPRQLSVLIAAAKADGVKVIFVQPQFDPRAAQTVAAAIGGEVVPLNDLAEDVMRNLETIATKITAALSK
jgi:zinc transport system substrate-binding protein